MLFFLLKQTILGLHSHDFRYNLPFPSAILVLQTPIWRTVCWPRSYQNANLNAIFSNSASSKCSCARLLAVLERLVEIRVSNCIEFQLLSDKSRPRSWRIKYRAMTIMDVCNKPRWSFRKRFCTTIEFVTNFSILELQFLCGIIRILTGFLLSILGHGKSATQREQNPAREARAERSKERRIWQAELQEQERLLKQQKLNEPGICFWDL